MAPDPCETKPSPVPTDAATRARGILRPVEPADIPAIGRLFLKVFRGIAAEADADLRDYLRRIALEAPGFDRGAGSLVYERPDGSIRSALLAVPMRFAACDRIVTARLLCAFMTDGPTESAGAAEISLTLRARQQDLAFSDTASPTSQNHFRALGGRAVPLQNLEWVRVYRPAGARLGRILRRALGYRSYGLLNLARPIDALLRARRGRVAPPSPSHLQVSEMPLEAFLDHAPVLVAHYAVRPVWSRDELAWFVAMAAQNNRLGPLAIRGVTAQDGAVVGAFVYHGRRNRPAQVLNVLARRGRETEVLNAMFRHLEAAGCTEAIGRAQPVLMPGLALQRGLILRHRAFVSVLTRHKDVGTAVERGDIYIGGLAGEDWSRMVWDFR